MFWLILAFGGLALYLGLFVREAMNGLEHGPGRRAYACLGAAFIGIFGMAYGWPDIFWWLR